MSKEIRAIHKPSQNRDPKADELLKAIIKSMQKRGREALNRKETDQND